MLIAVAIQGMMRMRDDMLAASEGLPVGTVEAISALGVSYVTFAEREQGVFRLMFGLTKDHEATPEMMEAGRACYGVLLGQVGAFHGLAADDPKVPPLAFPLWTMVHGTSFLIIDGKVDVTDLVVDIPTMIRNSTERLMGPRPSA